MNAITATDLTKRYGQKAAVSGATFEIEQGEIVGFLGPNGAGKTTTLRMLAGLVRPSSGTCTVLGDTVPGDSLREVGTMIEEPSFYPYMTGRQNLQHAAALHGDVPLRRIDESLEFERAQSEMVKSADRPGAVHNRVGEPCPVCDDTVRAVEYRAYTVAYCPTCQTGGKVLADNTTSKFLK